MKNLKIFTSLEDNFKPNNRYLGTFLHGKMELDYGYDLFSFERKQKFDEGVHEIEINGKDCTFILWKSKEERNPYPWRGYLIYSEDESRSFCINNYKQKKEYI